MDSWLLAKIGKIASQEKGITCKIFSDVENCGCAMHSAVGKLAERQIDVDSLAYLLGKYHLVFGDKK